VAPANFSAGLLTSTGSPRDCADAVASDRLAHRGGKPEWPHVIIYGHYEFSGDRSTFGRPPPFDPQIRGHRIYGSARRTQRSAYDHVAAVAGCWSVGPICRCGSLHGRKAKRKPEPQLSCRLSKATKTA